MPAHSKLLVFAQFWKIQAIFVEFSSQPMSTIYHHFIVEEYVQGTHHMAHSHKIHKNFTESLFVESKK